jgi:sulfite exporter TauE/SafE
VNPDIFAAFFVGLFGSAHCLLMCGGMAGALQMMMPQSPARRAWLQLMLGLGRVCSYALTGALLGGIGAAVIGSSGLLPQWLQLFAGLMLLAMALYISRLWFGLLMLERAGQRLWRLVQPVSRRLLPLDSSPKAFAYGLCWGYLPCGLVYSALSWSLGSGSAVNGALWMVLFGLGTLPAVMLAGQAADRLRQLQQQRWIRYALAALLGAYALQTIYLALRALVF